MTRIALTHHAEYRVVVAYVESGVGMSSRAREWREKSAEDFRCEHRRDGTSLTSLSRSRSYAQAEPCSPAPKTSIRMQFRLHESVKNLEIYYAQAGRVRRARSSQSRAV